MAKDAALYRYNLRFDGRAVDERRLREVIERHFGVHGMAVERTVLATPDQIAALKPGTSQAARKPRRAGPPPRAQRLLALLEDGKSWTTSALRKAAGGRQIGPYLVDLLREGLISRPQPGVYCKAGSEPPPKPDAARLPKPGSTAAHVHDLLAQAMTMAELGAALGRSRNTLDGTLSKLIRDGLVLRVEAGREAGGRHLFVRTDIGAEGILSRTPSLAETDARILSSLAVGTHHAPAGLASLLAVDVGHVGDRLVAMERRGLVEVGGMSGLRVASITAKGVRHPQYRPEAEKAATFDPGTQVGPATAAVVRALASLGAATTAEITAVSRWNGRIGLGQTVAALRDRGYVLTEEQGGRFRRHRLTKLGLALSKLLLAPSPGERDGSRVVERVEASRRSGRRAALRLPDGLEEELLALFERDGPMTAPEAMLRLGRDDLSLPVAVAAIAALEADGRLIRVAHRDRNPRDLIRWRAAK